MHRVLIISPHFPPTNAADHQRVRMGLPYLREHGWEVAVLAVDPNCVAAPVDAWLSAGLPAEVPVHRARALGLGWGRIPGLGSLTFRALGALRRQGEALLKTGRFDLVYFSTTQFGVHVLGPRWQRKFAVPFIMDYQDPWVSDYYRMHPEVRPPGGWFKYAVANRLNRRQEPLVLRHCAGITSVSPDYPRQLRKRYPFLTTDWPVEILPFPGDELDLTRVRHENVRQNVFSPNDGQRHWVYVGRGGADMQLALRGIFGALQKHGRHAPAFLNNLRLHFVGTSYAAAGRGQKTIEPLAKEFGLGGMVQEHTDRIPYAQALRCLLDANALIVPGSDDPGYTASKIYPYILAKKPLLAVFHSQSSVVELLKSTKAGTVVSFQTGESVVSVVERILATGWLQAPTVPATDWSEFEPYTAREMTRRLCRVFDRAVEGGGRRTEDGQR